MHIVHISFLADNLQGTKYVNQCSNNSSIGVSCRGFPVLTNLTKELCWEDFEEKLRWTSLSPSIKWSMWPWFSVAFYRLLDLEPGWISVGRGLLKPPSGGVWCLVPVHSCMANFDPTSLRKKEDFFENVVLWGSNETDAEKRAVGISVGETNVGWELETSFQHLFAARSFLRNETRHF